MSFYFEARFPVEHVEIQIYGYVTPLVLRTNRNITKMVKLMR
jgi:hypothetical protein